MMLGGRMALTLNPSTNAGGGTVNTVALLS